ncbi:lipopolysaccharide biosynthesis protein, partial [Helicobacter pylori]|nr:lipopolysaccharide biosynthesis protein [Helicobacter pylori]
QALEDCLKSPFDFVRLYGHYWGGHKTNLYALPIYTEAEETDYTEAEEAEAPIENHEVTPPPPIPYKIRNKILLTTRNKTPKNHLSLAK